MINGFALVDKSAGWTSHDVVARLRRLYGQRRVGHAGTLDPMATGVLVVGLGSATRLLRFVQGQPKTYLATIRLGVATTTDDAEGDVVSSPGWAPDLQVLRAAMSQLTGEIQQVPSSVSAIKVDGVRSYARVRSGEEVELAARPVSVHRFELLGDIHPTGDSADVDVEVACSSGTYVRALARDLGAALGTAGHLTSLRRTAIGPITVDGCHHLGDAPVPVATSEEVMTSLLPVVIPSPEAILGLRHGRPFDVDAVADGVCCAVSDEGELLAVVDVRSGHASVEVNLSAG